MIRRTLLNTINYNDGTISTLNDQPIFFASDPNTYQLPQNDVDALLRFELTYYAFGTTDSEGTKWIIRNGLDNTEMDSATKAETDGTTGKTPGSDILVKIGGGSQPPTPNTLVPTNSN